MAALERFLYATADSLLVRAGIARVQFETIHPFLDALKARPVVSLAEVCRTTGLSFPAASSGMELLVELAVARELTGKRRNRLFVYDRYGIWPF